MGLLEARLKSFRNTQVLIIAVILLFLNTILVQTFIVWLLLSIDYAYNSGFAKI